MQGVQTVTDMRHAAIEWTPEGAVTRFRDGASWGALPHPDKPHYAALAHRLGYEGDILTFCREHELAHNLIGEEFDQPSAVLWPLAHGMEPDRFGAAAEEALTMALQRYARANEVPLIDRVDWPRLRARFYALAGATK